MSFKIPLQDMLDRIPGAQGALIVDWEGESVDQVGVMDDYDLKLIGAYKGVILANLRNVASRVSDDPLQEIVITTEHAQLLVLPVTLEYFLALALDRSDLLGRALFEARRCLRVLRQEID